MSIDVAINYYGKPYHTMVALGSLLAHSGHLVDRIYVIKEREQPAGAEIIDGLLARHDWNIETFTPAYYLGWQRSRGVSVLLNRLFFGPRKESFRLSYRYQYALERTDKRWLFLTHNDVLFQGDVLTPLLRTAEEGGHAGAGDVGNCWKCPAHTAGLCLDHRPDRLCLTQTEANALYEQHPSAARGPGLPQLDPTNPIPFPECRLNEWFALVDAEVYRRETKPWGTTEPLGTYELGDIGIAWFASMMHKGYTFAHVEAPYAHPWTPQRGGGGHEALLNRELYEAEERAAMEYYLEHFAPR